MDICYLVVMFLPLTHYVTLQPAELEYWTLDMHNMVNPSTIFSNVLKK